MPYGHDVVDLLLEQVKLRERRPAVVCGDEVLSFGELAGRSSLLADHLQAVGVSPDDSVGLFVEPSVDLMVGAWGILFSGGAYLPLSPEYPEERLRYMIADSRTKVVFTSDQLKPRLAELCPPGVLIVTPQDVGSAAPAGSLPLRSPNAGQDRLAYVIYTSGSTGKPKGVMIEHRSVVNQLLWLGDEHGLADDKVVIQKTPMSFDAAQWEILAPGRGATVVMGTPGIYRDAEKLIQVIVENRVTTLQCVPTLLQALLDTELLSTCDSLTQVFSGGEALSRTLASHFLDVMPDCELVNVYGPTECTINSSSFVVDRASIDSYPQSIPIGLPARGTTYHVLDDAGDEVLDGEVGELHIGGTQLARGYLHQPGLTAERFIRDGSLFRTGDLVYRHPDGTAQFVARTDNQVKLRGFRVELDEIKLAIETHDWVKAASVLVKDDQHTGFQNLIACVELNPAEAALMDQGNHGAHHQSKAGRLQVRAQLSNPGVRADDLAGRSTTALAGASPAVRQRTQAFTRKSYRFYEGEAVREADLLRLLGRRVTGTGSRHVGEVGLAEFGEILRYFGSHVGEERILPKYGYASPGSLYATQLYLEINGIGDLASGVYYYHPLRHQLVLMSARPQSADAHVRIHFIGRLRAIEPVYRNNIVEVLEIETGHMVGLFEEVLPEHGLDIVAREYAPAVKDSLDCLPDDYYLGTFELVPYNGHREEHVDLYVQAHPGRVADLPSGQYRYADGRLTRFADDMVLRKQVIAINQAVYDRAAFGVTVVSRTGTGWLRYIDLGRTLQRLSMNDVHIGLMSSGYSSKSGDDLPSARRMDAILRANGEDSGPSYFFVGGRVTDEQWRSEGMKEDVVHMKGPAELIKDDLVTLLPDYMIPNKVVVFDSLPLTANGKIDAQALHASSLTEAGRTDRPFAAPRTGTERRVLALWKKLMRREVVSTLDDFFETGGNSLIAVGLVNRINRAFGSSLPLQVLFEASTVRDLARRLDDEHAATASRLVPLVETGTGGPVFCWPGLGGYPMNLRTLAAAAAFGRPFYGVQAHGINHGEDPYGTFAEMAAADVAEIRRVQPSGPYTLWGYSFGARVAFETAYLLEAAGETVENLVLIAPGSPKVDGGGPTGDVGYHDPAYVTILFSVFAGAVTGPAVGRCLAAAVDDETFAAFVCREFPGLDRDLVLRITRIVARTYRFKYTFAELAERRITAPITILKAAGDDRSFIEAGGAHDPRSATFTTLAADHYSVLKEPDISELVAAISRIGAEREEDIVPHVNIKHFPVPLTDEQEFELVMAVSAAVARAFGCDEGVVSIALEPVEKQLWNDNVYVPEIVNRKNLLHKSPNY
ncbi:amino acid adenylation domain-containing protein [Umezawaea sp. Da 62-37]|uniref:amino acid adenylation domain-containing protein n=1 Tax=Umezawaea sp. Da 62-37 TaxID=3075927 RepID=UPI0037DC822C